MIKSISLMNLASNGIYSRHGNANFYSTLEAEESFLTFTHPPTPLFPQSVRFPL